MGIFGIEIGKKDGEVETAKKQTSRVTMMQLPDETKFLGIDSNRRQPRQVTKRGDILFLDEDRVADDLTDLISWS